METNSSIPIPAEDLRQTVADLREQIDQLTKELDLFKAGCTEGTVAYQQIGAKLSDAEDTMDALREQIVELRKDQKRLDWLEKTAQVFHCTSDATDYSIILARSRNSRDGGPFIHSSLRSAIDYIASRP